MSALLLATLSLAQGTPSNREMLAALSELTAHARAESLRRRPDLAAPPRIGGREGFRLVKSAHESWSAGRATEAIAILRRSAPGSAALGRMLARRGDWAEARDVLGAGLSDEPGAVEPFLYALCAIEAATPPPAWERVGRAWLAFRLGLEKGEMDRLYPSGPEGARRMAWAVVARVMADASPSYLGGTSMVVYSEGGTKAISADDANIDAAESYTSLNLTDAPWAVAEAFRQYPDDPLAVHLVSLDGQYHWDSGYGIATRKELRSGADRLRKLYAPAMRRLRKGDALDFVLRERIAAPLGRVFVVGD